MLHSCTGDELVAGGREDPNVVAPGGLARFQKAVGDEDVAVDLAGEYTVRLPGPWDGPVRVIEVTPRAGDRLSYLLHDRLRMAKEVQLHMWTSVLERGARLAGGRLRDGVDVETRVVA